MTDALVAARARVLTTRAELATALDGASRPVGVVLTMGALHAGHAELVRTVRAEVGPDAPLVVTVFVNPLQFGPAEDLARYPRTLAADVELAGAAGADLVWAPAADEVYPDGPPQVRVDPGPLGSQLEGASRAGHFAGALTVVAKLLRLTCAAVTAFGEKDYQQLVLVRRMAHDLELGVRVVPVPTVRDGDGLARSSRNAYLGPAEREAALVLPTALRAGAAAGAGGAAAVLGRARAVLAEPRGSEPVELDYLELRGADLGPAPDLGPARLLGAVRVGRTRLIDNVAVSLGREG